MNDSGFVTAFLGPYLTIEFKLSEGHEQSAQLHLLKLTRSFDNKMICQDLQPESGVFSVPKDR